MQRAKDDGRTNYPSIVEKRKEYISAYRQYKGVLLKFKEAFPPSIYVITKAPKFGTNEEQEKTMLKSYKPFPNDNKSKEKSKKQLKDFTKYDEANYVNYLGKDLKQKLELTSSEAYSFAVLRQMLIFEPMAVNRNPNDTTPEQMRVG